MAYFFRWDQNWGMFAPSVFKNDGWYVFEAVRLRDKKVIDLNRNGQLINYAKPDNVLDLIKNDRWRKYYENFQFGGYSNIRSYYCNYLFNHWNAEHPKDSIYSLKIIYMEEFTKPNYEYSKPEKIDQCNCN